MAFRSKNEIALDAARTALAESDKTDAAIKDKRSAALLETDDNAAVLALDHELVELNHLRKIQNDRIALLQREVAKEEDQRRAKAEAKNKASVDADLEKLNEFAADYAKHIGAAAKIFHAWTDHALKCAMIHPWPRGVQEAAAFVPPEVLKLAQYEHARVGTGRIMSAGSVKRLDFPGGRIPSMDLEHQREKIKPLVDAVAERVAYAKNILHGKPIIIERKSA
jgi:hypothetical protein